jgi:meiosis-specific APC/C activator protein AMA1
VSPTKKQPRKAKNIPIIPFRVLDADSLRDDYYCSLLAYSPTVDRLAVGLGSHVYLWSEFKGKQKAHNGLPDSLTAPYAAHVTSLSFSSADGGSAILAIGRADGRITLWSPLDREPRFDSEQPSPVSCVSFRPTAVRRPSVREGFITMQTEELLVGDEVGNVYLYAVEWPDQTQRDLFDWHGSMTLLARISCHTQQICGITWSVDGEHFATGGNDNQMLLFRTKKVLQTPDRDSAEARRRARGDSDATVTVRSGITSTGRIEGQTEVLLILPGREKHVFTLNAAVKALAFAPWQPTLIAAGGGSNDRCIHFFHTGSGAALATIDCHAQVTGLVWSEHRKEIAATFGFAQPEHPFRVAVFAWPGCGLLVGIPWVTEERALYGIAYPKGPKADAMVGKARRRRDEGCLVVATSDGSIKFHEVWANNPPSTTLESGLFSGRLDLEKDDGGIR